MVLLASLPLPGSLYLEPGLGLITPNPQTPPALGLNGCGVILLAPWDWTLQDVRGLSVQVAWLRPCVPLLLAFGPIVKSSMPLVPHSSKAGENSSYLPQLLLRVLNVLMQVPHPVLPQSKWPINVRLPLQGLPLCLRSSGPVCRDNGPHLEATSPDGRSPPGSKSEAPLPRALSPLFTHSQNVC